jgi:hypothetical protein
MNCLKHFLPFVAGLTLSVNALAADKITAIAHSQKAPVIDGVLDEAIWANAVVVEDFHQVEPVEYGEPSERTQVLLLYTEDALFIGARLYDSESEKITAQMMRQGSSLRAEDRIKVIIDPYNDKRSGYEFEMNANGVRGGGIYIDGDVDRNWDGIFQVASAIVADGWVAEMEIPFKTLSFDGKGDWGLNLVREIPRKQETIAWSSRNRETNPAVAGTLTGLSDLSQGIGLDLVPSVSFNQHREYSPRDDDQTAEPSLDVFYKITPSINGSLTFNTDFSATEIDSRQVDLSRFNLFFPEKRAFFLRESDIFEFGGIGGDDNNATVSRPDSENARPYFSRRIGLGADGSPVDIDVGAKVSGRNGRWNFGTMVLRQAEYDGVDATNVMVTRVSANVQEESKLGFVATKGDPRTNLDNTLYGVDYSYRNTRLAGGKTIAADVWYQSTDTEGLEGDDSAFGLSVSAPNADGWRGMASVKEIEANFNPALGYVNRAGVRQYINQIGYTHFHNGDVIRSVFAGIDGQRVNELDGGLQSQNVMLRLFEVANNSDDEFTLRHDMKKENLIEPYEISDGVVIPVGEYSFNDTELALSTGEQRVMDIELIYRQGDFYNGSIRSVESTVQWRPSKFLDFSVSYAVDDVDLPYGDFITRLATFSNSVVFSNTLSWVNLVQYDNVSESVGFNSRVHWNPRAGQNVYFVVNHNYSENEVDNSFESVGTSVTLKFDYTLRY